MARRSAEQGFGLLELAVSLLLVAVLYGVLATSLSKTAEQAERAAMYGMLGQLQQQLNLKLAQYYIAGSSAHYKRWYGKTHFCGQVPHRIW